MTYDAASIRAIILCSIVGVCIGCGQQDEMVAIKPVPVSEVSRFVDPEVQSRRESDLPASKGWLAIEAISKSHPFITYQQSKAITQLSQSKDVAFDPAKLEAAKTQLRKYENSFKLLMDSHGVAAFQLPPEVPNKADYSELVRLKDIEKAAILRARILIAEGDPLSGTELLIRLRHIAKQTAECKGAVTSYLIGTGMETFIYRAIAEASWSEKFPIDSVRKFLDDLKGDHVGPEGYQDMLRAEFNDYFVPTLAQLEWPKIKGDTIESQQMLDWIYRAEPALRTCKVPLDKKKTVVDASEIIKVQIQNAALPYPFRISARKMIEDLRIGWPPSIYGEGQSGHGPVSSEEYERAAADLKNVENPLGRLLISTMLLTDEKIDASSFRRQAEFAVCKLEMALRLFATDHRGELPQKLSELVDGKYLESVPIDPFSDKPLRFDAKRRIIWSVGPNMIDEGGAGIQKMDFKKDFRWEIPPLRKTI